MRALIGSMVLALCAFAGPAGAQQAEDPLRLLDAAETRAALTGRVLCYSPTVTKQCDSIATATISETGEIRIASVGLMRLSDFRPNNLLVGYLRTRPAFANHAALFARLEALRRPGGYAFVRIEDAGGDTTFDAAENAWCSTYDLDVVAQRTRMVFTNGVETDAEGLALAPEDVRQIMDFIVEVLEDREVRQLLTVLDPDFVPSIDGLLGLKPLCEAFRADTGADPITRMRAEISVEGHRLVSLDEFISVHETADGLRLDPGEPGEGDI